MRCRMCLWSSRVAWPACHAHDRLRLGSGAGTGRRLFRCCRIANTELTHCFEAIVATCRESVSDIMFHEQSTHSSPGCKPTNVVTCRCTRTRMIGLCLQSAFRDSMTAKTSNQGAPQQDPGSSVSSVRHAKHNIPSTSKAQGNPACRDALKQHERSLSHWPSTSLAVSKRPATPARRIE